MLPIAFWQEIPPKNYLLTAHDDVFFSKFAVVISVDTAQRMLFLGAYLPKQQF